MWPSDATHASMVPGASPVATGAAVPAARTAMRRSIGRRVNRLPRASAVERLGDVDVPGAAERRGLIVAAGGRAVEGDGGAAGVAGGDHRELDVRDAVAGAQVPR